MQHKFVFSAEGNGVDCHRHYEILLCKGIPILQEPNEQYCEERWGTPCYLKEKYRDTDVVKFRIGSRKQYIQKSFSTSVQRASGSFIPEGSGSYAIEDIATGEKVIDFSDYTQLSCDSKSPYFIEHLNGFYPDRFYKILIKVKYDDNQEIIYDNDFEFKIVR